MRCKAHLHVVVVVVAAIHHVHLAILHARGRQPLVHFSQAPACLLICSTAAAMIAMSWRAFRMLACTPGHVRCPAPSARKAVTVNREAIV